MRIMALSLGAVGSLGVVALGGRTIAADRAAHLSRAPIVEAAAPASDAGTVDRVWYGGTLAPIVVVADRPERSRLHTARDCPTGGT